MCAVNPSCVSQTFDDAALRRYYLQRQRLPIGGREFQHRGASPFLRCYMAADRYQGQQYVCAGELVTLQTLTKSQGAEGRYH
jgi:hypothetical protein